MLFAPEDISVLRITFAILIYMFATSVVSAGPLTSFDFSTDDGGASIVNGQQIDDEFSSSFTVSVPFGVGVGAFDSSPGGPNVGDPAQADMLVGLGNLLIYQSRLLPTQTTAGVFDTPVDDTAGGTIVFDFTNVTQPSAITLVDIDNNAGAEVRLTDSAGNMRTYSVPDNWTTDGRIAPGFAELRLDTLADQDGGTGVLATAAEDAGFNASSVSRLEVQLLGSGGVDNLVLIPEPATLTGLLFAIGAVASFVRRRR